MVIRERRPTENHEENLKIMAGVWHHLVKSAWGHHTSQSCTSKCLSLLDALNKITYIYQSLKYWYRLWTQALEYRARDLWKADYLRELKPAGTEKRIVGNQICSFMEKCCEVESTNVFGFESGMVLLTMCSTYKLCLLSAPARWHVLTSHWEIMFLTSLVLFLCLQPPT